ncbi:hypothetical protein FGO68_gene5996 [Halteria grandinella]|uniref:ERCC1-like central domain-containing protein n=1 Tax=Halteria grandinella TaxID=5974 RepID=A0A8J8NIG3_HALGN|nr:hypothetical protein FGO68_gene5996 [Halteria grandinella]
MNKNLIRVNKKQETNPLLKTNRFQYTLVDDPTMPEDYDLNNEQTSVLFLSMQYHQAYPLYIVGRLDELARQRKNRNRILLCLMDNQSKSGGENDNAPLNSLTMQCMKFETTLLICWSFEEAAQYIQTLKAYEAKTQTLLEGKHLTFSTNANLTHLEQAGEVLSSIRRVNKTDARNLLQTYGSISGVIGVENYEEFLNIEGIGQNKIDSITACFRGRFHAK